MTHPIHVRFEVLDAPVSWACSGCGGALEGCVAVVGVQDRYGWCLVTYHGLCLLYTSWPGRRL